MKKHIQGFNKGINQDISTNKYSNQSYYDAQNLRLTNKDSLSIGLLANVKGTLPKLSLGTEHTIIGYCLIRETLIIFADSPEGGKIYKWEYNTDDVEESPTLIYVSPDLNFNKDQIIRAVGIYENEFTQKIYFTDGSTFFKYLNIIPQNNESYPLNDYRSVDSLDLISEVEFPKIDLDIIPGGNLKAGKIQYAYQLYSKGGNESMYSPASILVSLTSSENINTYDYVGNDAGEDVNKSVVVTINNLSINNNVYNRLRLVAIKYNFIDQIPAIRIVGEYNISNLDTLTVTDSGISTGTLTLEEFRFIQNEFYPKSIDTKDNRLFAANITTEYFHITEEEFDSRAFRFNKHHSCKVWNNNTEVQISPEWIGLPSYTEECYNKFNDWTLDSDYNNSFIINYEYKYRRDGTTLGGDGPNISYEFITTTVLLDDAAIEPNGWQVNNATNGQISFLPKQDIDCSLFTNHSNPNTPVGLKRDEIYRYGIVLFDKKGRPSFVKWIGDIRTPSNKEMPFISYSDNEPNKVYANILGIKFYVNTDNIQNKISGYQIVRAPRTKDDRTILTQGVLGYMKAPHEDETFMSSLGTLPFISDCINNKVLNNLYTTTGEYTNKRYTNNDAPLTDKYMELISPEIAFNKKSYSSSGAFIEVEGYLNKASTISTSGPVNDNLSVIVSNKYWNYGSPYSKYCKKINNFKVYTPKLRGNTSSDYGRDATLYVLEGGINFNNICNTGNAGEETHFRGARGTFGLINTDDGFNIDTDQEDWLGGTENRIFVANYRLDKGRSIYGGSTYEARLNTTYYPSSEFTNKNINFVDTYKGDTYINYMWYLRSMWDINWASGSDPGESDRIIENVIMFPVESSINLDLRTDTPQKYMNWGYARKEFFPNYKLLETSALGITSFSVKYPRDIGNLYRYNTAYSAIDKSREFYVEPFDYDYTTKNDTRITVSEQKINGEYNDSWTKFKFNNYIDVDSKYNAITRIITFKNNLFYFQSKAVGIASVNQRSVISDNQPGALVLGTGGILNRYDYITSKSGTSFYNGIVTSDNYIYYADGNRKRFNMLGQDKELALSVIKGIDSTLDKLNWDSVRLGFDRKYNEIIFAVDNTTYAFSESVSAFTSKYTYIPKLMFSINNDFFSVAQVEDETPLLYSDFEIDKIGYSGNTDIDPEWDYILIGPNGFGDRVYKHDVTEAGNFYGQSEIQDSYITLIINPENNNVCCFDTLDIRTESTKNNVDIPDDIFYELTASNNYQEIQRDLSFTIGSTNPNTGYKYNKGTVKRLGRIWRTPILPVQYSNTHRMVDTYIKITLKYNNSNNNKFKIHDITCIYRPSKH